MGRYFVWDAVRAVDVLAALPQVDATRIGVTGNSGGGVQTTLLMVADKRLAAAMPCTYITDMRAFFRTGQTLDAELAFPGTPAAGLDHADLLAAFAPRPLTVGGAAHDYFPIEGTEHVYEEARRLYALQGAADRIHLVVTRAVHSYGDEMREAAVRFFTRELAGAERYARRELPVLPEDALVCSPTGQLYRDRPGQRGLYELNREFYATHHRTPPEIGSRRGRVVSRCTRPHAGARRDANSGAFPGSGCLAGGRIGGGDGRPHRAARLLLVGDGCCRSRRGVAPIAPARRRHASLAGPAP